MSTATGLAFGPSPTPQLAARAVAIALRRARLDVATGVLLFLTPEFAVDPQPALLAASKTASCARVVGCTAPGIYTEEDWVLDTPAAAAMVFGNGISLAPAIDPADTEPLLTLAAPNAVNTVWLSGPGARFGGVSGDATGRGLFKVWSGRTADAGHCESVLRGTDGVAGVSYGVRALTEPLPVTRSHGNELLELDAALPALALRPHLPPERQSHPPLHLLTAGITFGDPATAVAAGRFHLSPIIALNGDGSATLASRVAGGDHVFWAMREPAIAVRDTRKVLEDLQRRLGRAPEFGLAFSCVGRGPAFFGDRDDDLDAFRDCFPGLPMAGFYGNGQFACLADGNRLLHYSNVLSLFARHVQP